MRLQRRFQLLSVATFTMAALAVAVVAVQVSFWPEHTWITGFEVLFLLVLLCVPLLSKRLRLHDRWTSHRFLAERLRSAYFLALAGTGDRGQTHGGHMSFSDPSVAWIERALAEISAIRPRPTLADADAAPLRDYLVSFWIDSQLIYHARTAETHERRDTRLRHATAALFAITLVAAALHLLRVGHVLFRSAAVAEILIVLSISVPAIGAAVHGVQTQRMYRHHSQRYLRMTSLLRRLGDLMRQAGTLPEIRHIAADVERVMREESNDWFGVMRFHDVELIT